jgi:hypothetical protein
MNGLKTMVTATEAKKMLPAKFFRSPGEPDQIKRNPMFRKAAPMQLFLRERIQKILDDPANAKELISSSRRRMAANASVDLRVSEAIKIAKEVPISVRKIDSSDLRQKAIKHYEKRSQERGDFNFVSEDAPDSFVTRITVNYLRHCCTQYESALDKFSGVVGVGSAYEVIRERVFAAIASAYPGLAAECKRQEKRGLLDA